MTSNILAGERRWASARRTGMTVLGKVAVPKPLNLPSQRLENHGLDPNVEIVPKGSLGWGGRSSSASNPWGSSSLSPNADGGASSPSHLCGRPSSGGTGSRPSTAGSDRTHERSGNAWGPSSRPSSASGTTASNQTAPLTSLRPHSAETRPGSSQLSRFAEPVSDNSAARSAFCNPDRMMVASSDSERFSLSTGDFPTLNSSRDSFVKNFDSRDQDSHSRPSSASGRIAQKKERAETSQVDAKSETVNTWRRDGQLSADDGIQPSMEKWHGEPHQYMNANIPPPQFDTWRAPSVNAPPGVWYRGPPAGLPYGAPVPPGGFPVEPFPYYCPQIPPAALANSQSVPLPGPGPRGHRPKNGELYRPQMPDAFVHPAMPFRPGFYPNPMTFKGYYGLPMGYNEREVPFKGMAAGPSVYNRYPAPNAPDIGNSHARAGKSGPTGKLLLEQVETAHTDDTPARYKVLLKQNNDEKEAVDNQEHSRTVNSAHSKGDQLGTPLRRNEWGADHDSEDEMHPSAIQAGNSLSCSLDEQGGYNPATVKIKTFEIVDDVAVEDSRIKKLETAPSSSLGMPQASSARDSALITVRDSTLMQKIEGLNEKVRSSDGRNDGRRTSKWEEQKSSFQDAGNIMSQTGNAAACDERIPALGTTAAVTHEKIVPVRDKASLPATAPRRSYEGVRGRSDVNGKRRFNNSDGDGWQKKPVAAESLNFPTANVASASDLQESRINSTLAAVANPSENNELESLSEALDSIDNLAQRAKLRELAKQRIIQLQKEEEERTREQKAKAYAKLQELNRRTQVTQGGSALNLKAEKDMLPCVPCQVQEGSQFLMKSGMSGSKSQALGPALVSTANIVTQVSESTGEGGGEVADSASYLPVEKSEPAPSEPVVSHGESLPPKQNMVSTGDPDYKTAPPKNDTGASRHKRNSYKPKQNTPLRTDVTENLVATDATKAPIDYTEVASDETGLVAPGEVVSGGESHLHNIPNIVAESHLQQRRKSNRTSKSKNKLDDPPSMPALPSKLPNESNPVDVSTENEISRLDIEFGSIQAAINAGDGAEFSEQHSSFPSEGVHGRVSSHRKPQQSRRFAKNQQSNRFMDKYHGNDNVVWAPVRAMSKGDSETETSQKSVQESVSMGNSDNQLQSNLKSKRAEMERYVPKPVAKELAQQGSGQPLPSCSVGLSASDETAEKVEHDLVSSGVQPGSSEFKNVVSTIESREGDFKQNKQLKAHGAWRQRGSVETMHVKGMQSGSSSSTPNPWKNTEVSVGHNESVKHEVIPARAERKSSKDLSVSDGGNVLMDFDIAAAPGSPRGRNQGGVRQGKRHALKGDRKMGNDHVHEKNLNSWETDRDHVHMGDPGLNQTEKLASSKENRGFEERTSSHWQPKSHSFSNNSQRGTKTIGQSNSGEASSFVKKDLPSQPQAHVTQRYVKDGNEVDCSQPDQSASENKISLDVVNERRQGQKKERKGRPYSPSESSFVADEPSHVVIVDSQNKQQFSSDIRRNRNQNNRPTTSRESRADWNQERQRQNTHYEYQPVGPYNNSKTEKAEDGSHNVGPRYKERGQSHSKRGGGNFHGQQSGNVQIDAGYD